MIATEIQNPNNTQPYYNPSQSRHYIFNILFTFVFTAKPRSSSSLLYIFLLFNNTIHYLLTRPRAVYYYIIMEFRYAMRIMIVPFELCLI